MDRPVPTVHVLAFGDDSGSTPLKGWFRFTRGGPDEPPAPPAPGEPNDGAADTPFVVRDPNTP